MIKARESVKDWIWAASVKVEVLSMDNGYNIYGLMQERWIQL